MSVRHLYRLKNYELKGGLRKFLREARRKGKSARTIAEELSQTGASVGKTAVQDWLNELEREKK